MCTVIWWKSQQKHAKKQMDLLVTFLDIDQITSRYFNSAVFGYGNPLHLYDLME